MYYYLEPDSENSICSPGQEVESSAESFSDIPAYVLLRLGLTDEKSCSKGNVMEYFQNSQSGMMSEPSMENLGGEKSMLYAADSPAKTLVSPEKAKVFQEKIVVFGQNLGESFAKFNLNSCSWKIRQLWLFADLDESLETWPRWGSMQNGECWELSMPGLLTGDCESGFWQTPTVQDVCGRDRQKQRDGTVILSLLGQVRMFPTPCVSDAGQRLKNRYSQGGQPLSREIGGAWNPDWVEWLMGWPIKWTEAKELPMAKFQQWLSSHGKPSYECPNKMSEVRGDAVQRPQQ